MRIEEDIRNSLSNILNINHSQFSLPHIKSYHLLSTKLLRPLSERNVVLVIETSIEKSTRHIELLEIFISFIFSIEMRNSVISLNGFAFIF